MTLWEYLRHQAVTLCFAGIGCVTFLCILAFAGVEPSFLWIICLFFLLLFSAWFFCGYLLSRRRLDRLNQILEELPEKYLLGELLPPPANLLEKQYFMIMKTVSRSAIGIADTARREKEEYCNYVESWIHEIKTPLTACSLILSNEGDIRKLKQEIKRADNLTESILYFARMRTAEKDLQIHETHAAALMDEAVKSQMELLIAARIRVTVEGDFSVCTDGKSILFILKQLLINCAKYCPGCQVTMTAGSGVITVWDDGPGIPSHELPRVTERGFSGTAGRKRGDSTGMGLYIAAELCKNLGVTLTVESEEGRFTRISLAFDSLTKL